MTPIEKRKAELREYIRKQEVEAEYLKDLSANKSAMSYYENARIAKQLLECIEALESVVDWESYCINQSMPAREVLYEACYTANTALNKIGRADASDI